MCGYSDCFLHSTATVYMFFGYSRIHVHAHTHTHTHTHSKVLLFDLGSAYWRLAEWRKELWELSHIGIPDDDKESRDCIVFGFLTNWFLTEVN